MVRDRERRINRGILIRIKKGQGLTDILTVKIIKMEHHNTLKICKKLRYLKI